METETWQINYFMRKDERDIPIKEPLNCKKGYHDALRAFAREHEFQDDEISPVYKVRCSTNYIELFCAGSDRFGGGFTVPLTPRQDLEGAFLVFDDNHPVVLNAPDGTGYRYSED